ncbi:ATP-grasp domain-containing protein [Kitasatospora sp. NBC_01287]|uniref:carboxylate--amine ligase n=1 Tax=Kitasatospora sp. NBC_01287 TaxID=2903573 RepID=UPI002253A5AF|nr:ATP-grasp domain-containing protein [Kitasatospora sp. NBC_01287]MCX4749932.1 ATP-grasp domain-containing protein [Kitasatospora sp. NBC_01287]
MTGPGLDLDRGVPALLVKVGRYPQHPGGLGVVRTLARCGVPVLAMVEDRFTPVALSRYLAGRAVRPPSGREEPEELVRSLLAVAERIGRRAMAVPTDDEAALVLAEHADRLRQGFLLPAVPPGLPRRLASKGELYRICQEYGVPTARSATPADRAELLAVGREWGYPLVLKNLEAWTRLRAPVVGGTTLVRDEAQLRAAVPAEGALSVLVQEYLPAERCEDWITHTYNGGTGRTELVFTGRKLRSWPPGAGVTSRADAPWNEELALMASELCERLGYRGPADMDWRLDRRDGRYKLVDFNPRVGAQFRLFENARGVDLVRAMHLDLTGREIPRAPQLTSRSMVVGQLDLPSALCWIRAHRRLPSAVLPRRGLQRAWLACDDPLPAAAEAGRFAATVARRLAGR